MIIIGLPIGFMIFNQLPLILTLRPRSQGYVADGTVEQLPLWIRAIWFIFVGWWLGAIYMTVAWSCACCSSRCRSACGCSTGSGRS